MTVNRQKLFFLEPQERSLEVSGSFGGDEVVIGYVTPSILAEVC